MMQTASWTEEEIRNEFAACHKLSELIQMIEAALSPRQMVCEVYVNGLFLSEEDERRFAETPVSDIKKLEVRSSELFQLLSESMTTVSEKLPSLSESALAAADYFRHGQEVLAQQQLSDVIDSCHLVSEALGLIKGPLQQLISQPEFLSLWSSCELSFSSTVKELVAAFGQSDYFLLADVLEYELTTSADKWLELLAEARTIIGREQGNT